MKINNVKENFCGACASIPLAMLGASFSARGKTSKEQYKTKRLNNLIISLSITLISFCIGIYYLYVLQCRACVL